MGKGAIWIGLVFIIFGIWLFFKVLYAKDIPFFIFIYPLLSIGIGIALMILHKEEEKIEQRKDIKTKKSNK